MNREHGEAAVSFDSLDFGSLWSGRERVTRIEGAALDEVLRESDPRRVLEAACGDGRLSPVVSAYAHEYVAIDLTPRFLARLPSRLPTRVRFLRLAADLYHLPFPDASFSTVVLFRAYNFLAEPIRALGEIARVLAPGGSLIVSVHTRPSVATLVDDLRLLLGTVPRGELRPSLLGSQEVVRVPAPFPTWVPTRRRFLQDAATAGFERVFERPMGLEDFVPFSWFPDSAVRTLSSRLARFDFCPFRLYRLRRGGKETGSLSEHDRLVVCPSCRAYLPIDQLEGKAPVVCTGCRRTWGCEEDVRDLRYSPLPGTNVAAGGSGTLPS